MVHPEDRLNSTFRTKWGTYAYQKMPFGLINAGETFQREMDIDFRGLINKSMVVYLDDITIYSKKINDHYHDLKQILEHCLKYGNSLNEKTSYFSLSEGNFLGFIVSKEEICIDLERIKEISKISPPHNKKSMQPFLGQINFVRRFFPNFSQIVLPFQAMIKKNSLFKWGHNEREYFDLIKQAIVNAPSLNTPFFSNNFLLYSFASETSYVVVLTQVNDQKIEAPISFFSSNLQGVELNYSKVEKQAFAIYKYLKHFKIFLLKTRTKVIVPFPTIRQLFMQKELGEKRTNWDTSLQEYDIDMKLAKIVRGQGL